VLNENQVGDIFHRLSFRIDLETALANSFFYPFDHFVVIAGLLHQLARRVGMELV